MEDIRSWTITRSNGEMDEWLSPLGSVRFFLLIIIVYSMETRWCHLGSLFNHSSHPNVSYTIDPAHDCIRYTSTRTINPDEELCIFYGHKLWFDPVGTAANLEPQVCLDQSDQSAFLDILAIGSEMDEAEQWDTKDPNDILEGEVLPFIWKKLQIDEEEESMEDIRTSTFSPAF
jgi:tRNA-specific adenosine deaminase 3